MITPATLEAVPIDDIESAILRHSREDWGELSESDLIANDTALLTDGRLCSSYIDCHGTSFWIITEADRSVTTVLLPDDY